MTAQPLTSLRPTQFARNYRVRRNKHDKRVDAIAYQVLERLSRSLNTSFNSRHTAIEKVAQIDVNQPRIKRWPLRYKLAKRAWRYLERRGLIKVTPDPTAIGRINVKVTERGFDKLIELES